MNDAPGPVSSVVSAAPPLSVPADISDSNTGAVVSEMVSTWYTDIDTTDLGMAVIYADTPDWGDWQHSSPDTGAWVSISDLDTNPLPAALKLEKTHRGPVPMSKLVSKMSCSVSEDDVEDDQCFAKIKKMCKKKDKERKFKALRTSLLGRNLRSLVADNDFDEEDNGTVSRQELISINLLLLSPDDRIRFQPKDRSKTWTTFEAMAETRLVFTAWDGSRGGEAGRMNMTLPWCCGCDGDMSLARDVSLYYADKLDCSGAPIVSQAKVINHYQLIILILIN